MLKRAVLFLTTLLSLLWIVPATAQDSGWTARLYNAADGRMTQVADTGAVLTDFTLPVPSGFDLYPQRIAVGHGGTPFAYVASNSSTFQGVLVISQGAALQSSFNLPLTFSDSTEFLADESMFNEDDSALALGYSLQGGGWGLIVFDLTIGTVTHTIRHDTPNVAVLGLSGNFGLTPVPRLFVGNEVTFSMVQSGAEGASEYETFIWNIDTDAITKTLAFPSLDSDLFLPTGEMVMSLPDDRLPNQSASFPFFQANTLHVFDPLTGGRFPFYNSPELTLFSPQFVQNGEYVLVNTTHVAGAYQWLVVGRDGNVVDSLPSSVTINDAAGVGDGFVYTTDTFSPGATTLVYVDTRDGADAGVPIWTSPAGATPIIAWAGDIVIRAQSAYAPWAKLADPVVVSNTGAQIAPAGGQPLLTPIAVSPGELGTAATPVFGRFLSPGSLAAINTTDGDQLNVRLAPSTTANVVTKLPDASRVTILEGPRSADGFVWWKIRTGSGIEGWVVESVDDNGTRLQTLIPE
jgi:hypothetical protein